MKIIAFYLPQYHQTPENDRWWEEGFTEWTNVKRAKPCFRHQIQPKIPLNDNYYDLMDKKTVEWQTKLMHQYGVYGFCYFHYWFMGKKLLYKPAENLLKWTDIDQPFCFAWANSTWTRTWTAYKGATTDWVIADAQDNGTGVLIEQKYGVQFNWMEHYNYLKTFFQDDRYIKVDNKPMFLIYHVENIDRAAEMFEVWNALAKQDGFAGIHIVSLNSVDRNNPYIEAVARYGLYTKYNRHYFYEVRKQIMKLLGKKAGGYVLNYKGVWKNIVKENPIKGIKTYPGALVTYDETPRRGENAIFIKGASPRLFEKYMRKQIEKAQKVYCSEFIFLDAWNEWGEGNYLEPDQEHGYAYLKALKRAAEE